MEKVRNCSKSFEFDIFAFIMYNIIIKNDKRGKSYLKNIKKTVGVLFGIFLCILVVHFAPKASAMVIGRINGSGVNVRSAPSNSADKLYSFSYDWVYVNKSEKGDSISSWGPTWYNVSTGDGKNGYVYGEYVYMSDGVTPEAQIYISKRAKMFAAPGTWNTFIGYVDPCNASSFGTLADDDGDLWYFVKTESGLSGFVYSSYVSSAPPQPPSPPVVPDSPSTNLPTVYVTDSVNIRSHPGTWNSLVGTISSGKVYSYGTELDTDGDVWYHIVTPSGLEGYIYSKYISETMPGMNDYIYDANFENNLLNFPESYRNSLRALHALYPNWRFYADNIPFTRYEAVSAEYGRKVVEKSCISDPSWSDGQKDSRYDNASRSCIQYFLSPENFLDSKSVFMFMNQCYDPNISSDSALKAIIKNTFLDNSAYPGIIKEAAKLSGVSELVIAATIITEQGSKGSSSLISGAYPGYEGYFNYFNIGAVDSNPIIGGLEYAKTHGWNSHLAAIAGGASFYAEKYISVGQNTYFYKDFNIKYPDKLWHQYATNVHDAYNSAQIISRSFTSEYSSEISFFIPVYKDEINISCSHNYVASVVEPTFTSNGYTRHTCSKCGDSYNDSYVPAIVRGDFSGDGLCDSDDAIILLLCGLNGQTPSQPADLNKDGMFDSDDAIYLLYHVLDPTSFPF